MRFYEVTQRSLKPSVACICCLQSKRTKRCLGHSVAQEKYSSWGSRVHVVAFELDLKVLQFVGSEDKQLSHSLLAEGCPGDVADVWEKEPPPACRGVVEELRDCAAGYQGWFVMLLRGFIMQ